jgi:hypothetical protein
MNEQQSQLSLPEIYAVYGETLLLNQVTIKRLADALNNVQNAYKELQDANQKLVDQLNVIKSEKQPENLKLVE